MYSSLHLFFQHTGYGSVGRGGYAFTAVLLVKIATLGLAVLAMILFMIRDGLSVVLPQVVIFVIISPYTHLGNSVYFVDQSGEGSIPLTSSPGQSSKTR